MVDFGVPKQNLHGIHLRLHGIETRIRFRFKGIEARIRTLLKGANAIVNVTKAAIETRIGGINASMDALPARNHELLVMIRFSFKGIKARIHRIVHILDTALPDVSKFERDSPIAVLIFPAGFIDAGTNGVESFKDHLLGF